MPFVLPEYLQPFLLPLLIAVPLAVLIWIITVRRGDHRDIGVPPPVPRTVPDPRRPLPASAPRQGSPSHGGPGAQPVGERLPLLLVDDSAVVRAKLLKLFQEAGYQAQTAKDGTEALELMAHTRFGVLLTDLEMPNMDGFELIKAVQGGMETEDLPIIAITGHEELHARLHQIQGLYGMFHKPWNDRELLKRVDTLSTMRRAHA